MAELDKVALYAQIDAKFPVTPLIKVKSQDANALCKDLVDSFFNKVDDAAAVASNIGTFGQFETIMNDDLNLPPLV